MKAFFKKILRLDFVCEEKEKKESGSFHIYILYNYMHLLPKMFLYAKFILCSYEPTIHPPNVCMQT